MNNFALSGRDIGQDAHEFRSGKVAYLTTPQSLHPLHAEVFKEQVVVLICQVVGQLEEPVTALVDHRLIDAGNVRFSFAPVIGKLDLAGHLATCLFQFSHCLAIVQRTFNFLTVRRSEESLQTKVESCAVTCQDTVAWVDLFLNDEVEPDIAKTITLDGDGLDIGWNTGAHWARLAELIDNPLDLDFIAVKQFPTSLFQREAAVLLDLLKAWGRGLYLALKVAEKQLVRLIDTLYDILNRLATDKVPMAVLGQPLKPGDVHHQGIRIQACTEQAIVPAMHGNTVVID